jgi:hypothetical protein
LIEKADEDRHARYIRDTLLPYLAYASRRVPEISDTFEDVDHAMEWGFGHQSGPFRTWDLLGVRETVEKMKAVDIEVAPWVKEMLNGEDESFYKKKGSKELVYSPASRKGTSRSPRTRWSFRSTVCARRAESSPATTRRACWIWATRPRRPRTHRCGPLPASVGAGGLPAQVGEGGVPRSREEREPPRADQPHARDRKTVEELIDVKLQVSAIG